MMSLGVSSMCCGPSQAGLQCLVALQHDCFFSPSVSCKTKVSCQLQVLAAIAYCLLLHVAWLHASHGLGV